MPESFNIGPVLIDSRLIMAPMAGYTNSSWRRLVRQLGCGLVYSELISTFGIYNKDPRTLSYLSVKEEERPVAIQIFGSEPAIMAAAAISVAEYADLIDINLACPAKKVIRNRSGAALLKEVPLAVAIAKAVAAAVEKPVTAKIRLGWVDKSTASELVPALAQVGIKAVAVHGRTAVQGFSGRADWDAIEELAERSPIPVIGNGDLTEPAQIAARLKMTACTGLMIGRAALANPWIFGQSMSMFESGGEPVPISKEQKIRTVIEYTLEVIDEFGEKRGIVMLRKHLFMFFKGSQYAARLRQRLTQVSTLAELVSILTEYQLESTTD